ncbi:hypothetical protein P3342_007865 [Pyrenophora teres f. teres]|nr:hypothetical protein P3342_007865 [Pyrenophora teres f. teres]
MPSRLSIIHCHAISPSYRGYGGASSVGRVGLVYPIPSHFPNFLPRPVLLPRLVALPHVVQGSVDQHLSPRRSSRSRLQTSSRHLQVIAQALARCYTPNYIIPPLTSP